MSDDGQFLLHGRAIDTLLSAEPAEVARLGWSDPDRVREVLERLANAWTAQPTTPLGALAQALAPDRRMLLDALLCLGIEQGLRLLEQADILDLFGRWALVRFLLSDPAFLTTDELAEVLEEFADHLEANQAFLISRGVPKTSLGASWPGTMLGYLYPTKPIYREDSPPMVDRAEPPSPRDCALRHLPAAKRATRRHSYWWLQADPSTSGEDAVLQEPFEDAARTVRLDEQTAARVEAGRAAFLALEITVLRTLANALRARDAANLLPECLRLMTGALTADEVAFYFRMDQWGYGYDIVSGIGEGKGYLAVFPGGLSNLLIVIGHCEQELAIGMMDRTKNSLPPEVLKNASFRSYFSYFQALGELWQLVHCQSTVAIRTPRR